MDFFANAIGTPVLQMHGYDSVFANVIVNRIAVANHGADGRTIRHRRHDCRYHPANGLSTGDRHC
jgi:hypothetical protein